MQRREGGQMNALLFPGRHMLPGLIGGEGEHRRQQAQQGIQDLVQDGLGAVAA